MYGIWGTLENGEEGYIDIMPEWEAAYGAWKELDNALCIIDMETDEIIWD